MKTSLMNAAALSAIAAAALALAAGCASPVDGEGRLRSRVFQVELSALDWLDMAYHPATNPAAALSAHPIRVSISGAGEVVCRTGRSPQIWNSFSTETSHQHWNDVVSDRAHLEPAAMRDLLQRFIDDGVLARRLPSKPVAPPYVVAVGNISGEKIRITTDNGRLVSLAEEVLENFPALLLPR